MAETLADNPSKLVLDDASLVCNNLFSPRLDWGWQWLIVFESGCQTLISQSPVSKVCSLKVATEPTGSAFGEIQSTFPYTIIGGHIPVCSQTLWCHSHPPFLGLAYTDLFSLFPRGNQWIWSPHEPSLFWINLRSTIPLWPRSRVATHMKPSLSTACLTITIWYYLAPRERRK